MAELKSYPGTLTDKLRWTVADLIRALGADPYTAGKFGEKVAGVAELLPVSGNILAGGQVGPEAGVLENVLGTVAAALPAGGGVAAKLPKLQITQDVIKSLDKKIAEGAATPLTLGEVPQVLDELDFAKLKNIGPELGSNPGGSFVDEAGKKFYVKEMDPARVVNENVAAELYKLAGVNVLPYKKVAGGKHVASEWQDFDVLGGHKFLDDDRREAAKDLVAHAWLGNWDAVGTGMDNVAMKGNTPVWLDLGGALEYRAKGLPKGEKFGTTVDELNTLRDWGRNPDSAEFFEGIDPDIMLAGMDRLAKIKPEQIREAVKRGGGSDALADKLIARKESIDQSYLETDPVLGFKVTPAPSAAKLDETPAPSALSVAEAEKKFAQVPYLTGHSEWDKLLAPYWDDLTPETQAWYRQNAPDWQNPTVFDKKTFKELKSAADLEPYTYAGTDFLPVFAEPKPQVSSLEEEAIANALAKNPGASISDIAGVPAEQSLLPNTGPNYLQRKESAASTSYEQFLEPLDWQAMLRKADKYGQERVAVPLPTQGDPQGMGFNLNLPVFKGGSKVEHRQLPDPSKKDYERGSFFSDTPEVAAAYGMGENLPYYLRADRPAAIDWMRATAGDPDYSEIYMTPIIEAARKQGHDLLVVKNIIDEGSAVPQNQYVVLDASIARAPGAKFDPEKKLAKDIWAGLGGAGVVGAGVAGSGDPASAHHEQTIGIEVDGQHIVIPTVVGGKKLSDADAVKAWQAGTNKELGTFGTQQEADTFAKARSHAAPPTQAPAMPTAPASPASRIDQIIESLRKQGIPITVTSGYRDPAHNKAVGGAEGSKHLDDKARDVSLKGLSEAQKQTVVRAFQSDPTVGGFGYYPGSDSIHVDVRTGPKAAWGANRSSSSVGVGWPGWMAQDTRAWQGGGGAAVPPMVTPPTAVGASSGPSVLATPTAPVPQAQPWPAPQAAAAAAPGFDLSKLVQGLGQIAGGFGAMNPPLPTLAPPPLPGPRPSTAIPPIFPALMQDPKALNKLLDPGGLFFGLR